MWQWGALERPPVDICDHSCPVSYSHKIIMCAEDMSNTGRKNSAVDTTEYQENIKEKRMMTDSLK